MTCRGYPIPMLFPSDSQANLDAGTRDGKGEGGRMHEFILALCARAIGVPDSWYPGVSAKAKAIAR